MNEQTETPPAIRIGADGVDAHRIEREILDAVAAKRARGEYDDAAVARAERNNILALKDDKEFMERYLACLRQIVPVDINDFEIQEHRSRLAPLLKALKRTIWKLLKFYTYRLWSQQNQTNGVLLAAIEILDRRHAAEMTELRSRIEALEKAAAK